MGAGVDVWSLDSITEAAIEGEFISWAESRGYNVRRADKPVTRDGGITWFHAFVDNVTQAAYQGFGIGVVTALEKSCAKGAA